MGLAPETTNSSAGASSNAEVLLELEGITKDYMLGQDQLPALRGVGMQIVRGEFVALMGPSGSGKSTLMNILGCLDNPSSGTYRLSGQDVSRLTERELARVRNREIGFVFQSFNLLPRATAIANVELPLVYRGTAPAKRREKALEALRRVGLQERVEHKPTELSGGQCQRVAVARALVTEPALLLADEPTGNLDSATAAEILDLFSEIHAQGNTILLVTHDAEVAERADRSLRLKDGLIVEESRR